MLTELDVLAVIELIMVGCGITYVQLCEISKCTANWDGI